MLCSHCGTKNPQGANFCIACGSSMHSAPVVKITLRARLKTLSGQLLHFLRKYRLFAVAATVLAGFTICVCLFCSIFADNDPYDAHKHSIGLYLKGDKLVLALDASKAKPVDLESYAIVYHKASMDGSILVVRTIDGQLAVIQGTKVRVITDEVSNYYISADGTGVAYTSQDGYALYLYNVKTRKTTKITPCLYNTEYALSPDGDTVCYYEQETAEGDIRLMCYQVGKYTKIATGHANLISLSNNGKYIYVVDSGEQNMDTLYCYDLRGNRDRIGNCYAKNFIFNKDHTQILYYSRQDSYTTYISANGGEGHAIASGCLVPLLPQNAKTFSRGGLETVPTDDLYDKLYECDNSILRVRKSSTVTLVEDAAACVSHDGELLYYWIDGNLWVLRVRDGEQAQEKATLLASDVMGYQVTSDCKYVYYITDGAVYRIDGKTGENKITVAEGGVVTPLCINADDVVYFIKGGDAYAARNGKAKLVIEDAETMYDVPNGVVYILTNDARYASMKGSKPVKLYDKDTE